jgi:NAD(P)-dependent dehydrogenase (short-subunit alcohol dehydrogenase family)
VLSSEDSPAARVRRAALASNRSIGRTTRGRHRARYPSRDDRIHDIRVNTVDPTGVNSPMVNNEFRRIVDAQRSQDQPAAESAACRTDRTRRHERGSLDLLRPSAPRCRT